MTEGYRSNTDTLTYKFKQEIPVWPLSSCHRCWWAAGWCWTLWRGWRKRSRTARLQLARLPHFRSVRHKIKLIRKNRNRRQTVISFKKKSQSGVHLLRQSLRQNANSLRFCLCFDQDCMGLTWREHSNRLVTVTMWSPLVIQVFLLKESSRNGKKTTSLSTQAALKTRQINTDSLSAPTSRIIDSLSFFTLRGQNLSLFTTLGDINGRLPRPFGLQHRGSLLAFSLHLRRVNKNTC